MKIYIPKYILSIIILSLFISLIYSEECDKESPIKKEDQCQAIYCSEIDFINETCIISNSIIQTQWLNLIKLTKENYLYLNTLIDRNGDLLILSRPDNSNNNINETIDINSKRIFYGLDKNYQPLFSNSDRKEFEASPPIINDGEAQIINLKIGSNCNYYFVSGENYVEFFDFNLNIMKYQNLATFLGEEQKSKSAYIETSEGGNKLLYAFINCLSGCYIDLHIYSFNSSDFSDYTVQEAPINIYFDKKFDKLPCYRTEEKFIICLIVKEEGSSFLYYQIMTYDYESNISKLISSTKVNANQIIEPDLLFYKCIHLKNEIGVVGYFLSEEEKIFHIDLMEDKEEIITETFTNEMNETTGYNIISRNIIFSEKFKETISNTNLNSHVNENDLIKINDNRFSYMYITNDKIKLIIFLFDLFNEDNNLVYRTYSIDFRLYNLVNSTNLKSISFNNLLGVAFSSLKENEGLNNNSTNDTIITGSVNYFALFGYVNSKENNNKNIFSNNRDYYEFYLSNYSNSSSIENNLFGLEIERYKIITLNIDSGINVKSKSNDFILAENDTLYPSEIMQIVITGEGAKFGEYKIEYAPILREPSSYSNMIKYTDNIKFYDNIENKNFYQPQKYLGKSVIFTFEIEGCYVTCKDCQRRGTNYNNRCGNCSSSYPENILNGTKCFPRCPSSSYLYYDNNTCIPEEACNDLNTFLDYSYKYCISECKNSFIHTLYYENTCVGECPIGNTLMGDSQVCKETPPEECKNLYYIESNKIICVDSGICPKHLPYIYGRKCVQYAYTYRNKPVEKCPEGTCISIDKYCKDLGNEYTNFGGYCVSNIGSITQNIKSFSESGSTIQVTEGVSINAYSNEKTLEEMINENKDLTYIDLGQCKEDIISYYNIDPNTNFYILGIESENKLSNSTVNSYGYDVYFENGTKIDIKKICKDSGITMSSPITRVDMINKDYAVDFSSKGFDIYDLESNFYQDRCTVANMNNQDLALSVRKEEIYPSDIDVCLNGCKYKAIDFETNRFDCNCDVDDTSNGREIAGENFFEYVSDEINYKLFTCYKEFFDKDNYKKPNMGFYLGIFCIIVFIVNIIYFYVKGLKDLKISLYNNNFNINNSSKQLLYLSSPRFSKKKSTSKEIEIFSQSKSPKKNENEIILKANPPPKFVKSLEKSMIYSYSGGSLSPIEFHDIQNNERVVIPPIRKKEKGKEKEKDSNEEKEKEKVDKSNANKKNKKKSNKFSKYAFLEDRLFLKHIYKEDIIQDENENPQPIININQLSSKDERSEEPSVKKNECINDGIKKKKTFAKSRELIENDIPYKIALDIDHRSFLSIFMNVLIKKFDIIQMFVYPEEFLCKAICINIFILSFILDFFINSLLYSDDVVAEKYHRNGSLEAATSIFLSLASNIVSSIIIFYVKKLTAYHMFLCSIYNEIKNENDYFFMISTGLQYTKVSIAGFTVAGIVIICVSMFYLTLFCFIYFHSQISLLINYAIGVLESLLISLTSAIIVTTLRKIGLKYENKQIYETSKFIDNKI